MTERMSELPSRAAFEGAVNASFAVGPFVMPDGTTAPVELVLARVNGLGQNPESFELVFRGPLSPALAQGLYPFDHPKLGRHELFIVPIARDAQGVEYEAVFNRG